MRGNYINQSNNISAVFIQNYEIFYNREKNKLLIWAESVLIRLTPDLQINGQTYAIKIIFFYCVV